MLPPPKEPTPEPHIVPEDAHELIFSEKGGMIKTYVGDIDPKTKLRVGKGRYTYSNNFFQYNGEWKNGKKDGTGYLLMRDGSKYHGEWKDGEMTGQGCRFWTDGTFYEGYWLNGEKHGYGEITYSNGDQYKGDWV